MACGLGQVEVIYFFFPETLAVNKNGDKGKKEITSAVINILFNLCFINKDNSYMNGK